MPAGGDVLEDPRDSGTPSRRSDRRDGTHVHEIDHRDRCVVREVRILK